MLSRFIYLIIFILSTFYLNAQTVLQGKISDENTDTIIGASVVIMQHDSIVQGAISDFDGNYIFTNIDAGSYDVAFSSLGCTKKKILNVIVSEGSTTKLDAVLEQEGEMLEEIAIVEYRVPLIDFDQSSSVKTVTSENISNSPLKNTSRIAATSAGISSDSRGNINVRGSRTNATTYYVDGIRVTNAGLKSKKRKGRNEEIYNEEIHPEEGNYTSINENSFLNTLKEPLSTLSIDVDRASYSNVRRMLQAGNRPPIDAVRVEEFINYFQYDINLKNRSKNRPFQTQTTLTDCPWNEDHQMLHVILQGDKIEQKKMPASNLVFLIDVSGSMNSANKLPLLKSSFKLLVNQMRVEDRIAIVVYAGAAGEVLASTSGGDKTTIMDAITKLNAGGSTAGGAGIQLAYDIAKRNFIEGGNNRVILATDGDFNVGTSGDDALVKLLEKEREHDIFLSIMGFGIGNYKDGKMQKIADAGNGNHSYIDNMQEAKKVFQDEFTGTLFTIAKDVKIQIEFNPEKVGSYRMVGYENRLLAAEDFNDDSKDAGEMGAGHQVTVIYELIPPKAKSHFTKKIDALKYRKMMTQVSNSSELATIKYRYKPADGDTSIKSEEVIENNVVDFNRTGTAIQWSAAVAEFGMYLRESPYAVDRDYEALISAMKNLSLNDNDIHKKECVELVEIANQLSMKYTAVK